jgi:hypothetical protein
VPSIFDSLEVKVLVLPNQMPSEQSPEPRWRDGTRPRTIGISREALYLALSEDGNPELGTALKVMHALGVKLSATMVA